MDWTSVGLLALKTSKHPSSGTPPAYSMVPMAPSQSSGPSASRDRNGLIAISPPAPAGGGGRESAAPPGRRPARPFRPRGGLAPEQGAGAGPQRPRVERLELAREPDHRPHRLQRLHAPLPAGEPAAGRDHVAALESEQIEEVGFELPEPRLPLGPEDFRNRPAIAPHDEIVGFDEAAAEPLRQEPSHRRLPGSHEPDENDVLTRVHMREAS